VGVMVRRAAVTLARLADAPSRARMACYLAGQVDGPRLEKAQLRRIEMLSKQDMETGLAEAQTHILSLLGRMENLEVFTGKNTVNLLVELGSVLNLVAAILGKRSYGEWIRSKFVAQHRRYFEHARQLAAAGPFVRANATLGKNRLLELLRASKARGCSPEQLMAAHPLEGDGSDGRRNHADAIITYTRLANLAPQVTFRHAQAFVAAKCRAIRAAEAPSLAGAIGGLAEPNISDALEAFLAEARAAPLAPVGRSELAEALQTVLGCLECLEEIDQADIGLASAVHTALSRRLYSRPSPPSQGRLF